MQRWLTALKLRGLRTATLRNMVTEQLLTVMRKEKFSNQAQNNEFLRRVRKLLRRGRAKEGIQLMLKAVPIKRMAEKSTESFKHHIYPPQQAAVMLKAIKLMFMLGNLKKQARLRESRHK